MNLLIDWRGGRLLAALSDGHTLGRIAEHAVAQEVLTQLASQAELVRQGSWRERQWLGRTLLQQLIPQPIAAALAASIGSELHLQLSPGLNALPWEWALSPAGTEGPRTRIYRHLLRDAPVIRARGDGHRRHRRHLRVLIVHRHDLDAAARDYCHNLLRRLNATDALSAHLLPLSGEALQAPELRAIGDCDVLHGLGDVSRLLSCRSEPEDSSWRAPLALQTITTMAASPQLLVMEATAPAPGATSRPPPPLDLPLCATEAGLATLWHWMPAGPRHDQAMADFYAALARGRNLGEALAALHPGEGLGDLVAHVDPTVLLAPASMISHPDDHTRQITVLCYDLVESTALLRKLGAERYTETLDRFHSLCADVLARWGGRTNPPQGNDGVMCFFGLPIAHEDAPAMSLKAASALTQAVAQMQLQVRVGVVTGLVVVRGGVPLGEPIHLAARLAALAEPGGTVVSGSTRAIVQGRFGFTAVADVPALKGFDRDEAAFVLTGELANGIDVPPEVRETPWTGRATEFAHLQTAWATACSGRIRSLVVSGEAGIGKSRLVREFRRSLVRQSQQLIELRCSPEHTGSAYRPLIETLNLWFRLNEGEPMHEMRQKLELRLQGFQNRQHIVDGLALLLDPQPAGTETAATRLPEKIRQQVIDALLLWTDTLTGRGPVCLIIEDHNWLDPSSRELLQRIVADCAQRPLFLLLTERTEHGRPVTPAEGHDVLELGGLSAQDTESLLRSLCGDTTLPSSLVDSMVAKTDGIPLFIEETARALLARQETLIRRPGAMGTDAPALVAGKVQDLLMARLDRLNAAKVVAQFGSSIGRQFSQALIQAVCAHESAPIQVDGVLFHLEALVRAGILGQSSQGKDVRYHFRHALMQEAAYQSLWERDRRLCHSTVARVISESFPGLAASQPEVLARHCSAAGLPEPAIQYLENAARLAISRAAQEEASAHLDAALALIESVSAGASRDRTELRLLLLQAGQGIALHGYGAEQVGTCYRRAETLSRHCGDDRALLRVQFGLEGYHFMRGEFRRAHEVAAGAAELLQRVADPMRRVQAQWAMANLVFHEGDLADAVRRMDHCLADYGRLEQRPGQMQDPAVMSLSYSALAQWTLGFPDDALARADQAMALATRLKHPFSLGEAHGLKAMLHCYRREYLDTLECAQRAIHVCESSGFTVWLAHARIMHGWATAHLGNPTAGLAEMAAGYAQWTGTGAVVTCAFYLGVQAEALALAGEPEQGLALLEQALAIAQRCGERYFEPELCRLRGELLVHSKNKSKEINRDKAQDWFLRSIEVARELGQRAFEARAAQSLAALWHSQGRMAEAQALLTSANKVSMIS